MGSAIVGMLAFVGVIALLQWFSERVLGSKAKEEQRRYLKARADVAEILEAIERYHAEYGKYPILESRNDQQPGGSLVRVLLAEHTQWGQPFYAYIAEHNPKMINFAPSLMGRRAINNMIVDPWDEPYYVAMDTDGDGIVTFTLTGFTHDMRLIDEMVLRIHRPVVVWSSGPDRRDGRGFGDDICSWHEH